MTNPSKNLCSDVFRCFWQDEIISDKHWQMVLFTRSLRQRAMSSMQMHKRLASPMGFLEMPKSRALEMGANEAAECEWRQVHYILRRYEQNNVVHPQLLNIAIDTEMLSAKGRLLNQQLLAGIDPDTRMILLEDTLKAMELALSVVFPHIWGKAAANGGNQRRMMA